MGGANVQVDEDVKLSRMQLAGDPCLVQSCKGRQAHRDRAAQSNIFLCSCFSLAPAIQTNVSAYLSGSHKRSTRCVCSASNSNTQPESKAARSELSRCAAASSACRKSPQEQPMATPPVACARKGSLRSVLPERPLHASAAALHNRIGCAACRKLFSSGSVRISGNDVCDAVDATQGRAACGFDAQRRRKE